MTVAATTPRRRPPLRPGREALPGYRVIGHLSRSRTYDVYDVWSETRGCRCIAKVIRPDKRVRQSPERHLIAEAELLGRLSHPHIVRPYEWGTEPEPHLIMETLTGATLGYILLARDRRLPLLDVIVLGHQLSSALQYLHRHGTLHLDMKPSNIVAERGIAKLIDLSCARHAGPLPGRIGSDAYMAPEQAGVGAVTGATDVWGLGVVLFEAATSDVPFPSAGVHGSFPQIRRRAPTLASRRRAPSLFTALVDACLEPEPTARPTLAEVTQRLEELLPA